MTVGPLDIMDAQAVTLAGVGIGIAEDGGAKIDVVDNFGVVYADGLEEFLAGQDGVGAVAIDVEGGDVEAGLVAGILRGSGANATSGIGGQEGGGILVGYAAARYGYAMVTYPGSLGTRGLGSPSARLGGPEGGREPP